MEAVESRDKFGCLPFLHNYTDSTGSKQAEELERERSKRRERECEKGAEIT